MIIDTCYRDGVEIWERTGGTPRRVTVPFQPPFYLHLPDPATHRELLEALETDYGARECTFRTILGECDGHVVQAGREISEAIERQTGYSVQLSNVDVRLDQRYLAGQNRVPCCSGGESRVSLDCPLPFRVLEVQVQGNPFGTDAFCAIDVIADRRERLEGAEQTVLADLAGFLETWDPDVVLFPRSDLWLPRLLAATWKRGIPIPFSRSGRYRKMAAKSPRSSRHCRNWSRLARRYGQGHETGYAARGWEGSQRRG